MCFVEITPRAAPWTRDDGFGLPIAAARFEDDCEVARARSRRAANRGMPAVRRAGDGERNQRGAPPVDQPPGDHRTGRAGPVGPDPNSSRSVVRTRGRHGPGRPGTTGCAPRRESGDATTATRSSGRAAAARDRPGLPVEDFAGLVEDPDGQLRAAAADFERAFRPVRRSSRRAPRCPTSTRTLTAAGAGAPGPAGTRVHATVRSERPSAIGQVPVQTSTSREELGGLSDANAAAIGSGNTASAAAAFARLRLPPSAPNSPPGRGHRIHRASPEP